MAVGCTPNTDDLGLENTGVEIAEHSAAEADGCDHGLFALFDCLTDVLTNLLVNIAPVLQGALEEWFGGAAKQAPGNGRHQALEGGRLIHDFADEGAGSDELVVLALRLGVADEFAGRAPGGCFGIVLGVAAASPLPLGTFTGSATFCTHMASSLL